MNKNPLISVIIPVKNGSNYIHEAIEGIKKQKMDVEIIVVDDASDDKTAEIAQSMGCTVVKHDKSRGQVAAKNTGLGIAKGSYILFHDHDDVMNEGVLPLMYEELIKDKTLYAVMSKVKDFMSPDVNETSNYRIKPEPYWGLLTGATLFKKEVFYKTGPFDEELTTGEIITLTAKMTKYEMEIKKLDLVSTNRRIHNTNYGIKNKKKEYLDYSKILRKKLLNKI